MPTKPKTTQKPEKASKKDDADKKAEKADKQDKTEKTEKKTSGKGGASEKKSNRNLNECVAFIYGGVAMKTSYIYVFAVDNKEVAEYVRKNFVPYHGKDLSGRIAKCANAEDTLAEVLNQAGKKDYVVEPNCNILKCSVKSGSELLKEVTGCNTVSILKLDPNKQKKGKAKGASKSKKTKSDDDADNDDGDENDDNAASGEEESGEDDDHSSGDEDGDNAGEDDPSEKEEEPAKKKTTQKKNEKSKKAGNTGKAAKK